MRLKGLVSGLFAAMLVGGASVAAAPIASAQQCSVQGNMHWGVKESFRKYIVGRVAQGQYTVSGGATDSGNGFNFPVRSSNITASGAGEVRFDGQLTFYGHDGALDIVMNDFALQISGSQAHLIADFQSYHFAGYVKGVKGEPNNGNDEVIVTVDLDQPADFSSGNVNLSGTTSLASGGEKLFGDFYENNEAMDPTSGQLTTSNCGNLPQGNGGGAGGSNANRGQTDSGATTGTAGLLGGINDTLIEVNGLLVNTDNVLANGESLHNRVSPSQSGKNSNTGGGGATTTSHGGGGTTTGGGGNSGGQTTTSGGGGASRGGGGGNAAAPGGGGNGATAGSASTSGGGASAGGGGASSGDVCSADGSVGVTSADAQWGVRGSFRNYIRGNIAKGGWNLTGINFSGDTFNYTGTSGAVNPNNNSGSILFPGTLHFYGHGGILDTQFSNMEIQFNGNSGQLIVDAKSNDVEGNPHDYGRIALANLSFSSLDVNSSSASGRASTSLTSVGADAFGQFYPEGDALDDISFTATLGGSPNCATGQGGQASGSGAGSAAGKEAADRLRAGALGGSSNGSDDPLSADHLAHTESSEDGNGLANGSAFGFKNKGAAGDGIWDDTAIASLIAILASMGVSGASLWRFVRRF